MEVEELCDEPAARHDLLALGASDVERPLDELLTLALTTHRAGDLGVVDDQPLSVLAIVGDADDIVVLDELEPRPVRVLADVRLHASSIPAIARGRTYGT